MFFTRHCCLDRVKALEWQTFRVPNASPEPIASLSQFELSLICKNFNFIYELLQFLVKLNSLLYLYAKVHLAWWMVITHYYTKQLQDNYGELNLIKPSGSAFLPGVCLKV